MAEKRIEKIRCTRLSGDCDCRSCRRAYDRKLAEFDLGNGERVIIYEPETC